MSRFPTFAVILMAALVSACAQQQTADDDVPGRGDPELLKMRDSVSDEVYINPEASAEYLDEARRIYVAPLNTSNTQIIQPRGVSEGDMDAWVMTPEEDDIFQNKMLTEFTRGF